MPALTQALLITNVLAFLLSPFASPSLVDALALWPLGSGQFLP